MIRYVVIINGIRNSYCGFHFFCPTPSGVYFFFFFFAIWENLNFLSSNHASISCNIDRSFKISSLKEAACRALELFLWKVYPNHYRYCKIYSQKSIKTQSPLILIFLFFKSSQSTQYSSIPVAII